MIYTNVVLTAAHCIKEKINVQLAVVVGLNSITTPIDVDNSPYLYFASHSKYHEQCGPVYHSVVNDIALIKLKKHVTLSSTIALICLPPDASSASKIIYNIAVIAGWGSIKIFL